jgi:hypothetical protein
MRKLHEKSRQNERRHCGLLPFKPRLNKGCDFYIFYICFTGRLQPTSTAIAGLTRNLVEQDPVKSTTCRTLCAVWIPAYAGMTVAHAVIAGLTRNLIEQDPVKSTTCRTLCAAWIPAYAGMTVTHAVIAGLTRNLIEQDPVKSTTCRTLCAVWIPAYAGMTVARRKL